MNWKRIGGHTFKDGLYVVQNHGYHWGAWYNRENLGNTETEEEAKLLCLDHALACVSEIRGPKTLDQWIDEQPLTS